MKNRHESIYSILLRSEEKGRGVLETVLYTLFILSAVILIWQFALYPVTVPAAGLQRAPCVVCNTAIEKDSARS
jgi:hypothetical protein